MLHAAAAMLKIAEMSYGGANSMFLRALLDKKYTLPYRVIDGLVAHFTRLDSNGLFQDSDNVLLINFMLCVRCHCQCVLIN